MADLTDSIQENAQRPAKVSSDAGSVEQHSLADQIAADRYLASKAAARAPRRGLVFNKLIPPGASQVVCTDAPVVAMEGHWGLRSAACVAGFSYQSPLRRGGNYR